MITRRQFLRYSALAAGYCLLPMPHCLAFTGPAPAQGRLIVLLLRGAVDGLSVVVPYGEREYYANRNSIALHPPGTQDGVLNLDGFFGLHPALAPLMPFWQNGSLAFVHATGFSSNERSHFEAQDIIETASLAHAGDGWMNALIGLLPKTSSPTQALSFTNDLPKIMTGKYNVASVPQGLKPDSHPALQNPKIEGAFSALYEKDPRLQPLFQEAMASRNQLIADLQKDMAASGRNAPYPDGFPGEAARMAAMIKQDPGIALMFMDLGGWDTHIGQGNHKGQLADRLGKLGEGLAQLANDLGDHFANTSLLVLSEFGRTVAENGDGGTDHGHGNVMWLMGGGVQGGKVHGRWPGLAKHQLFEGRDLAATTHFCSVIAATLEVRFGLDRRRIAQILPDLPPDDSLTLFG